MFRRSRISASRYYDHPTIGAISLSVSYSYEHRHKRTYWLHIHDSVIRISRDDMVDLINTFKLEAASNAE